jgi:thioesterase domain-containing protein
MMTDIIAVEHNIPTKESKTEPAPRRPDLSTFFSTLELVDTSNPEDHHNAHAQPQPENTAAAFRLLANAFEMMRGRPTEEGGESREEGDLLANMIEYLRQNADDPPDELKGVPDSFLDELERVPNKSLKPTDTCPICVNPFLEGTPCVACLSVYTKVG